MKNKLLILILLAAFLIRVLGVYPGYPAGKHADEWMSYETVVEMLKNGDLKPRQYFYPSGVSLLHYFVYRAFILPPLLTKIFLFHPRMYLTAIKIGFPRFFKEFSVLIFGNGTVRAIYWSRYLNALLSTIIVFLVYLVGKKLFSKKVGLLAAFFLTFNFRHVLSSPLGLADTPNGVITILSFYFSYLLFEKPSRRRYFLAGLGAALAFSTKFQFFTLVTFGLAHFLIFLKKPSWRALFNPNFFLALSLMPIVFVILNPYWVLENKEALRILRDESRRYAVGRMKLYPYALGYLYQYGIGKLMSVAILLGMLITILKKFKQALFLLSLIIPFFFVLVWYSRGGLYSRNFTPVIPFLLVFAAVGISQVTTWISKPFKLGEKCQTFIIILLAAIICAAPAKNSLIHTFYRMRDWNFESLAYWLEKELPYNSKVAIHRGVIWALDSEIIKKKVNFYEIDTHSDYIDLAELRQAGFDYAILSYEGLAVPNLLWEGMNSSSGSQYWQVPIKRLSNNFMSLMAKELLVCSVADSLKPWQTFENRYVVTRIPPLFTGQKTLIKNFSFDSPNDIWEARGKFGFEVKGFVYNPQVGYKDKGSLETTDNISIDTLRFASAPIPIQGGKKYYVSAWVKRETNSSDEKDGFLRMDFYDKERVSDLEQVGNEVALSSRISTLGQWQKLEVRRIAPANASFMTISFQVINPADSSYFIDDVAVFEQEISEEELSFLSHCRRSKADWTFIFPLGVL